MKILYVFLKASLVLALLSQAINAYLPVEKYGKRQISESSYKINPDMAIWYEKTGTKTKDSLLTDLLTNNKGVDSILSNTKTLYANQKKRDALFWTNTILPINPDAISQYQSMWVKGSQFYPQYLKMRVLCRLTFFLSYNADKHYVSTMPNGAVLKPRLEPYEMEIGIAGDGQSNRTFSANVNERSKKLWPYSTASAISHGGRMLINFERDLDVKNAIFKIDGKSYLSPRQFATHAFTYIRDSSEYYIGEVKLALDKQNFIKYISTQTDNFLFKQNFHLVTAFGGLGNKFKVSNGVEDIEGIIGPEGFGIVDLIDR